MSRYSSTRSSHLLSDNSWIKKDDDEDEYIDSDPNFAKTVLSQRSETTVGPDGEEIKTTTTTTKRSVHDLTKRFSGSQDELTGSSTLPSSKTSSYTRSTYSSLKSDSPSSTRTTTVSKDGTITETTVTTTQNLKAPVIKSPSLTETFSERVKSSSRGSQYTSYSPSRTTQVTETVTSEQDAVDNLYDKLLPSAIRGDYSSTERKNAVSTTETMVVKSSTDNEAEDKLFNTLSHLSPKGDYSPTDSSTTTVSQMKNGIRTTTTTKTSSSAEDDLYGTLLPKAITSVSSQSSPVSSSSSSITKREIITVESSRGGERATLSSPSSTHRTSSYSSYTDDLPSTRTTSYSISSTPSDEYSSDRRSYSYSKPDSSYEYTSTTSPSVYTSKSFRTNSRSDDVYSTSERTVLEKDLCTSCRRPFTGDAKMVLEDMKINCHASCFKCEVCNSTLGHMKAGDSMWIYKRMVHCENCFEVTRDKWRC